VNGLPLTGSDLEAAETIFDIFLLLFEWLKEREGSVISLNPSSQPRFGEMLKGLLDICARLRETDSEFRDRGVLSAAAKQEVVRSLLDIEDADPRPAFYGALVGIDTAFGPEVHRPSSQMNRRFRDRGDVRYLRGAALPYKLDDLARAYGTVGSRIENRLQTLTVTFSPMNGYRTEFVHVSEQVLGLFEACPSPKFAVAPLRAEADALEIEATEEPPGEPPFFRATATDRDEVSARLTALLSAATEEKADILVFPELSFTTDLLARLRAELQQRHSDIIKLVVAGTCWENGRNICHVLGPDGNDLWQQPKLNRFVILPGELPGGPEPIRTEGGVEDIDISDRGIRIADFPFGRLAVLVCLDFILPETYALLSSLHVNCLIVPSMTPSSARFETLGWAHAAATGATTIFCNAPNCPGFSAKSRSFVHTPLKKRKIIRIGAGPQWERSMLVFSARPLRGRTAKTEA
jgi:predicted amidohydrolase